jgi:NAD(P)-dependent dehydrogenase (short-subunit alcohol dehydrogenase family)
MRGLAGKVVVVAGGGSGIGAAVAQRGAEEGASVVVGDLDHERAEGVAARINASGGRAVAVEFDIATETGAELLIDAAVDQFGGVDCVHVNAADMSRTGVGGESDQTIESVPLELFDHTLAVDLRGHVLVTRRVLRELVARGGGAIVYTSSVTAFLGEPTRPSYAMAKSGLLALVRHVASAWGPRGVRANAVVPGLIVKEELPAEPTPELAALLAENTVRSTRVGRPEDVAALVAFLCSDDGEWINGQAIGVDGGLLLR